ncbi:glycosyltransferase family 2 protein [Burkholderia multivorans]|uniref:glycosyltransferase family 2 protein n=1 Tax=Burkholderia multivorans TaxID=87883 RepID=UPI001C24CC03|nr:glycosyltransferase family 2 protein [Burkholderia multivorans]MBU9136969.1 glycosyltransferase family 2 protein [Burkholderia multivorans]MBU9467024.1 glycosyltransferase family 2 protein [Burkholderia multivorans]MCA8128093.1 glycosyltransferase family 2 protein [Burkholderia multivorans]
MITKRIAAVVVTRNRKAMLVESVTRMLAQTHVPDRIFVIDNASTDGTREHLEASGLLRDKRLELVSRDVNDGGAGGFHHGLDLAVGLGYDWIWLMDDDCFPEVDALEQLLRPLDIANDPIGFICSHVVWRDRTPHVMNLPGIKLRPHGRVFSEQIGEGVLVVPTCSFVSVLINRAAIEQCGLPLREMFVWGDDLEFTGRITRAGYLGYFAFRSVVVHDTRRNANDDLTSADESEFFKYRYGIRNNLMIIRRTRGLASYVAALVEQLTVVNVRLLLGRRQSRLAAVVVNTGATVRSLFFAPRVVKPTGHR